MNAPVFGKVVKLNLFGQFARTLSTLLENGVPVLTALKITEQIIPNCIVKEAIAKTREEVTDGKTIAQPLARSKIFPQLMVDLVKIGEDTGDVPGALEKRGRHLRKRAEHRLARHDQHDRAGDDHRHGHRRRFPPAERALRHVRHHGQYRALSDAVRKSKVQRHVVPCCVLPGGTRPTHPSAHSAFPATPSPSSKS